VKVEATVLILRVRVVFVCVVCLFVYVKLEKRLDEVTWLQNKIVEEPEKAKFMKRD